VGDVRVRRGGAAEGALGDLAGPCHEPKQWEHAAIVWAFTENKPRGRPEQVNDGKPPCTIAAFAALGITGLRNREQVAEYRKAWQSAMDDGQVQVQEPLWT
jgi:hypothetical protein